MSGHLSMGSAGSGLVQALGDLATWVCDGVRGCDGASVSLVRDGSVKTVAATQERVMVLDQAQYRDGDGPCLGAIRSHEVVTVDDFGTDRRWPGVAAEALRAGVHSSLSLALVDQRGETLGSLNMYGDVPGGFTAVSRQAAVVFARHALLLIVYQQRLHDERSARVKEYEVATTLQRSLLPTLPALDGITCASRYLASHEQAQVGGDWYDLFALPDGAIGVAIGDVMGHDLAAAAAMGQLRSVLRSYAYEGSSPSVVLDRLDRLVQGFEMAQVATAIFGRLVLDEDGATLLFSNAGHLPPVIRYPDGGVQRVDRGTSPLIGVLPPGGWRRSEAAVALPTGSLLVLYTDGLVENRSRDYDTGVDQLCAALAATDPHASPEETCEAIVAAMGQTWEDDVALLIVRTGNTTERT